MWIIKLITNTHSSYLSSFFLKYISKNRKINRSKKKDEGVWIIKIIIKIIFKNKNKTTNKSLDDSMRAGLRHVSDDIESYAKRRGKRRGRGKNVAI